MKPEEKHIYDYLVHSGYCDIAYEPDGNVPPDFLIDRRIAIEVRRLNQHFTAGTEKEGLENASITTWKMLKEIMNNYGPPRTGETSWYVSFTFDRPLEPWATLKKKVEKALKEFYSSPPTVQMTLRPVANFSLEMTPASVAFDRLFVMAAQHDLDSGGWLLWEIQKNLRICIEEKLKKIQKVRMKYPEWWLILVDQLAFDLNDIDPHELRAAIPAISEWDKVVVVHYCDPTKSVTL